MFKRFNADARLLVTETTSETRGCGHAMSNTGHMLMAILRGNMNASALLSGPAAAVTDLDQHLFWDLKPGPGSPQFVPFDLDIRAIFEAAPAQADALGDAEVGSEHLLLAMLDVGLDAESPAGKAIAAMGITAQDVRDGIIRKRAASESVPVVPRRKFTGYAAMFAGAAEEFSRGVELVLSDATFVRDTKAAARADLRHGFEVVRVGFSLAPDEYFTVTAGGSTREESGRFLDYQAALQVAERDGSGWGGVAVMTPVRRDVTATEADGTEVVIGHEVTWAKRFIPATLVEQV